MKKIIKRISELMIGTFFIWGTILGGIITEKLSQIITINQIVTVATIIAIISTIKLFKE